MNELIRITEKDGRKAVSAKELYLFLSIDDGKNFSKWAKTNIEEMFIQYVDYQSLRVNNEKGGRPLNDYALTLDCAKEIAMMSRCDNGKQARQYFIECEKQLQKPLSELEVLQHSLNLLIEQEKKVNAIEKRVTKIESRPEINAPIEHFSIMGYCHNIGKQISLNEALNLGRKCSKMCKELGLMIGKISDSRYGAVNTYPLDILKQIIN